MIYKRIMSHESWVEIWLRGIDSYVSYDGVCEGGRGIVMTTWEQAHAVLTIGNKKAPAE